MAVKVYLANESEIVKEGIKSILSINALFTFCNEGRSLIADIEQFHPNIIFVDADTKNYDLCRDIVSTERIKNRMFIVAIYRDNDMNYNYSLNNINGMFLINVKKEEFYRGLLEMLKTGKYIQEALKKIIIQKNAEKNPDKAKINSLTKREIEILIQVANGMFNKEIANSLSITERTVKNHLSSIFKKIEVSDRTQAAVFAIRNEIVEI